MKIGRRTSKDHQPSEARKTAGLSYDRNRFMFHAGRYFVVLPKEAKMAAIGLTNLGASPQICPFARVNYACRSDGGRKWGSARRR
jgi:hypothetical protein